MAFFLYKKKLSYSADTKKIVDMLIESQFNNRFVSTFSWTLAMQSTIESPKWWQVKTHAIKSNQIVFVCIFFYLLLPGVTRHTNKLYMYIVQAGNVELKLDYGDIIGKKEIKERAKNIKT